jgi:HNH endonuclease/Helix-turn-helix
MSKQKTHEERLSNHVVKEGCWIFGGSQSRLGYGMVAWWENGILHGTRAHRLAWLTWVGPIPDGLHVLHHCDNRLCINPEHLWLGTHADNMRDMASKGRRKGINAGEHNGRSKLTQEDADEIRRIYAKGGRSQQSIADEFGISQDAVSKIIRGKRYADA